jgi:leader peptidase (prepilin peptidase)/N-methyltransferase
VPPVLPFGIHVITSIIVFLMGLTAGCFLNVLIERIPVNKPIKPPLFQCPACSENMGIARVIPIAWYIKNKGKCAHCSAKFSFSYLMAELLTGMVWLLVYLRYGISFESLALIYLFSILVAVAFIDFKHYIIPNKLVLAALAGGSVVFICHVFYRPFALYDPPLWYTPLIGMVSASGFLFVIAIVGLLIYKNDDAMGMGDVKIFLPIGLFFGWKLAILSLFISVVSGAVISIILLILRIKNRKSTIPFGPFIVFAAIIAGLCGNSFIY